MAAEALQYKRQIRHAKREILDIEDEIDCLNDSANFIDATTSARLRQRILRENRAECKTLARVIAECYQEIARYERRLAKN